MSVEENKAFIRRYFEAISGKEKTPELLGQFMDDENLKEHIGRSEAAFPRYELTPEDIIGEGDRVVVRYTARLKHGGEFLGVPPTGREFAVEGIAIYRMQDGKIAEHWMQADLAEVMRLTLDDQVPKEPGREESASETRAVKGIYRSLDEARRQLQITQNRLVHQEKLASLGALAAGIAHEIKNPLNFVNNFAAISVELADDIIRAVEAGDVREILPLVEDLKLNSAKIEEHGRRADRVVRSMLEHSRGTKGERTETEVNALVEEYVNLAYHGMRAQRADFSCAVERDYDERAGSVRVVPQEIGRVLLNLLGNAFYAVHQRAAAAEENYVPTVRVRTRRREGSIEVSVGDNGPGIPPENRERIFEPFFTTKPTGEGTGLGLSLSYEIVTQGHGGTLSIESVGDQETVFTMTLPVH